MWRFVGLCAARGPLPKFVMETATWRECLRNLLMTRQSLHYIRRPLEVSRDGDLELIEERALLGRLRHHSPEPDLAPVCRWQNSVRAL